MMKCKKVNIDDLLSKVADSMGIKVVTWDNVEETTDKDISFVMLMDIDKYFTEDEKNSLRQKTFIGRSDGSS